MTDMDEKGGQHKGSTVHAWNIMSKVMRMKASPSTGVYEKCPPSIPVMHSPTAGYMWEQHQVMYTPLTIFSPQPLLTECVLVFIDSLCSLFSPVLPPQCNLTINKEDKSQTVQKNEEKWKSQRVQHKLIMCFPVLTELTAE